LVIAELEGDDLILCQITSQSISDRYAISVDDHDFKTGALRKRSNVRPNRIFTADHHIIRRQVGHLKLETIDQIIEKIVDILRQ
jgi:mRNA interferase MazF